MVREGVSGVSGTNCVTLNTTGTGTVAIKMPRVNGHVNVVVFGNNGWYIGGSFTEVGGVTRNNLAHIT